MKMNRQMKKVPAKSRQKLFNMNISNFFIRNMGIRLVVSIEDAKVVQKREEGKFLIES